MTGPTNDVLARAKFALKDITEGPWATDGVLIGCELVKEAPGVTSYKYAIAEMDEDAYDEEGGPGVYDGEMFRPFEQMEADAEFLAASRHLVPELVAEVERLRAREAQARKQALLVRGRIPDTAYLQGRDDFAATILATLDAPEADQ